MAPFYWTIKLYCCRQNRSSRSSGRSGQSVRSSVMMRDQLSCANKSIATYCGWRSEGPSSVMVAIGQAPSANQNLQQALTRECWEDSEGREACEDISELRVKAELFAGGVHKVPFFIGVSCYGLNMVYRLSADGQMRGVGVVRARLMVVWAGSAEGVLKREFYFS